MVHTSSWGVAPHGADATPRTPWASCGQDRKTANARRVIPVSASSTSDAVAPSVRTGRRSGRCAEAQEMGPVAFSTLDNKSGRLLTAGGSITTASLEFEIAGLCLKTSTSQGSALEPPNTASHRGPARPSQQPKSKPVALHTPVGIISVRNGPSRRNRRTDRPSYARPSLLGQHKTTAVKTRCSVRGPDKESQRVATHARRADVDELEVAHLASIYGPSHREIACAAGLRRGGQFRCADQPRQGD